ncbi:MAG: hypothetical protein IKE94_01250 [Aeriscardovia sp.]|nr:hypothetical protein [Aeriscardovia sp.]
MSIHVNYPTSLSELRERVKDETGRELAWIGCYNRDPYSGTITLYDDDEMQDDVFGIELIIESRGFIDDSETTVNYEPYFVYMYDEAGMIPFTDRRFSNLIEAVDYYDSIKPVYACDILM